MALRRTLEMLKAGDRINDLLYRDTVDGSRRWPAQCWRSGRQARDEASDHGKDDAETDDTPTSGARDPCRG
jgi:hypothetical protein